MKIYASNGGAVLDSLQKALNSISSSDYNAAVLELGKANDLANSEEALNNCASWIKTAVINIVGKDFKNACLSISKAIELLKATVTATSMLSKDIPLPLLCSGLVAYLDCLKFSYNHLHWTTTQYDNHLLFQRLYEKLDEEIDSVVEKCIGLCGDATKFHPKYRAETLNDLLSKEDIINPLLCEQSFVSFCSYIIKTQNVSEGFKNLIGELQDEHEGHQYLLRNVFNGITLK